VLDLALSSSKLELSIVKEFLNLHAYVSELGSQFNLAFERLERIELQLKEMSVTFNELLTSNKNEIVDIREKMFTKTDFDDFIARVRPLYSKKRIIGFANRINVHPGIVVGQLQHRDEIKYSQNREMLVKVRETLASAALTDGWGYSLPSSI